MSRSENSLHDRSEESKKTCTEPGAEPTYNLTRFGGFLLPKGATWQTLKTPSAIP